MARRIPDLMPASMHPGSRTRHQSQGKKTAAAGTGGRSSAIENISMVIGVLAALPKAIDSTTKKCLERID
jgi:hypothetical protein